MFPNFLKAAFPLRTRVRLLHWKVTGHWPSYSNPITLSEKICWRKAHLRCIPKARRLLAITCDKVTVRNFLTDIGLSKHLTRDFRHASSWDQLAEGGLPNRFILKASHGSTWNRLVPDLESENPAQLRKLCNEWLSRRWGTTAGEWWYDDATPQVLVEEWLDDGANPVPPDYKLFITSGRVILIQQDYDKSNSLHRNLYLPPWQHIRASFNEKAQGEPTPPPSKLNEMIAIAEMIGQYIDFARVDFYICGERLIIGEITHAPASGWIKFSERELDHALGEQMPNYGPSWRWSPVHTYP